MPELSEILERLQSMGYCKHFGIVGSSAVHGASVLAIDDIRLVDSVSTDMGTDPGDEATVYLLEIGDGERGYLVLPDGLHVDPATASFVDRLMSAASR
jgi:hypothetical protein